MFGIRSKNKTLVKECIKGKATAQKTLYNMFASKVLAVCYRYAKNKVDAEDIFQSGWLKVYENIQQLRNSELLEWWVKRIFINEALQFYKKTERINFSDNEYSLERENNQDNKIYLKFQNDEITNLIQALPNKMRMVFNLYIIEGFSHKEIADIMNITVGTSKSQLYEARKILQKQIAQLNISKTIKYSSL